MARTPPRAARRAPIEAPAGAHRPLSERIDYSDHVRKHESRTVRFLLVALGFVLVGIGIAGVLLPLLPATPFFLLAAACFARASERCYNWLLNNRIVGPTVREWHFHRSIAYRTKLWAIVLMSGTLAVSTVLFVEDGLAQAGLAVLCLLLTVWMWRIPSRDAPRRRPR